MKKKIILPLIVSTLGFVSLHASALPLPATNLVTNGGFEDDFAGWNTSDDFFITDDLAHTGMHSAVSTCGGAECVAGPGTGSYIAQTLATAAGGIYSLRFWVAEDAVPPAAFSVFWNGMLIDTVPNPAPIGAGFVEYVYSDLAASGASTTFELHGRQDTASIYFDDVSVSAAGDVPPDDVPEPASLALMGLGLAGVAALRRKDGAARS
jgi:hypothetical protein